MYPSEQITCQPSFRFCLNQQTDECIDWSHCTEKPQFPELVVEQDSHERLHGSCMQDEEQLVDVVHLVQQESFVIPTSRIAQDRASPASRWRCALRFEREV